MSDSEWLYFNYSSWEAYFLVEYYSIISEDLLAKVQCTILPITYAISNIVSADCIPSGTNNSNYTLHLILKRLALSARSRVSVTEVSAEA